MWQWAVNYDSSFWKDPEDFAPERFMGDERYKEDQQDAMQPFSMGPRNCIGKKYVFISPSVLPCILLHT